MPCEHAVALGDELFEARKRGILVAARPIERQLEPPLVGEIEWIEERRRFCGVDQDGDAEAPTRLPERIELRVVHLQTAPVDLLEPQSEILVDLQPERPGSDVLLELGGRSRAETRADATAEVDVREEHHAIAMGARLQRLEVFLQAVA